jgi:hypothetical protein
VLPGAIKILPRAELIQIEQGLLASVSTVSLDSYQCCIVLTLVLTIPVLYPPSPSLLVVHDTRLPDLVFCDLAACFLTLVQAAGGYCNLSLSSSPWPSPCLLSTYCPVTSLVLFVDRVPTVVDPEQFQSLCSNGHAPHVFHFRRRRLCHNRRALTHSAQLICAEYLGNPRCNKSLTVMDSRPRSARYCHDLAVVVPEIHNAGHL